MPDKHRSSNSDRFSHFLKSRHLRQTPERFEILRCIRERTGHFDVETVMNELEKSHYHVSRSTIYNTIELLCESGIVRRLIFNTHQAVYEMARCSHSHLVCEKCGSIKELETTEIDKILSGKEIEGFVMNHSTTIIYGLCEACNISNQEQKKIQKKDKT